MSSLLGGLAPSTFLRRHWQKRPLVVRQAIPGFSGILPRGHGGRDALLSLASRPDAISRLVLHHPGQRQLWERHDGPFGHLDASMLPKERWTLLVHGIESLVRGGWELLRRFAFIPAARIDDLMISYAATGGSVGPHVDRYDVFLLQGPGRRRWQVATQGDRTHDPDAAIKVLRSFSPEEEWVLEPGDMLYLPPGVAHHGVAEEPSFTYSIGFLAPAHLELQQSFLGYVAGALPSDADALYHDPQLAVPREPLAIGDEMLRYVNRVLDGIRWDPGLVEEFLGCFLTRPKPCVRFIAPTRPLSVEAFARRLRQSGRLTLALPSRGLLRRGLLFFNGRAHRLAPRPLAVFTRLLGDRALPLPRTPAPSAATLELLHRWYLTGELELYGPSA
jgi:50S ribosomal protein L16 3-hydroxylase